MDENYRNEKYEKRFREFLQKGYRIESPTDENFDRILDQVYDMIMELYSDFPIFKSLSREDFKELYSSYKLIINMSMTKIAFFEDKSLFSISPRTSGLHIFRHILPKSSLIHKVLPAVLASSGEKSDGAIRTRGDTEQALRQLASISAFRIMPTRSIMPIFSAFPKS